MLFWIFSTLFFPVEFLKNNPSLMKLIALLLFLGMHRLQNLSPDLFLSDPGQKVYTASYIILFFIMFFELAVHYPYYWRSVS